MNEAKFVITTRDAGGVKDRHETDDVQLANEIWKSVSDDKGIKQAKMVVVTTTQLASIARA
jgi:hypothetical protein